MIDIVAVSLSMQMLILSFWNGQRFTLIAVFFSSLLIIIIIIITASKCFPVEK